MASEHDRSHSGKIIRQPVYRDCFVCGVENPIGLKVKFYNDDHKVWTDFTPRAEHQGWPGLLHGGILYTLLDETVGRAAFMKNMWVMTARMQVRYRHPTPLGQPIHIEGEIVRMRGRAMEASGRAILPDGTVTAEAVGTFIALPPAMHAEVAEVIDEHEFKEVETTETDR